MTKREKNETTETTEERSGAHKAWLASLGVVEVALENGGRLFDYLVEKGESFEARHQEDFDGAKQRAREAGRGARDRVQATWNRVSSSVDGKVSAAFSRVGVSEEEIESLKARVEDLSLKVEGLRPDPAKV